MVDTAVEKFGALHVAFNNAGVAKFASFADITEDVIDANLSINAKSLAWCFKYQVSHNTTKSLPSNDEQMAWMRRTYRA